MKLGPARAGATISGRLQHKIGAMSHGKAGAAVGICSTSAGLESTFIELKLAGLRVEDISILFSSGADDIAR